MDGKSCARLLVIAGFTRIHAATDNRPSWLCIRPDPSRPLNDDRHAVLALSQQRVRVGGDGGEGSAAGSGSGASQRPL